MHMEESPNEPYKANYLGNKNIHSKGSLHRENKYSYRSHEKTEKNVISFVSKSHATLNGSLHLNQEAPITEDNYITEMTV